MAFGKHNLPMDLTDSDFKLPWKGFFGPNVGYTLAVCATGAEPTDSDFAQGAILIVVGGTPAMKRNASALGTAASWSTSATFA